MKTFIIAAVTVDGFIARNATHAAIWTSKEDKARFVKLTKEAGVIVMGSTTFDTLPHPLKERRNIVYTRNKKYPAPVETTTEDPKELVSRLKTDGASGIAVCGGASIYTAFMKAGVVDKLYLTIEPLLFGNGISLFSESLDHKLALVSSETTPTGTIFAEYDVTYPTIQ